MPQDPNDGVGGASSPPPQEAFDALAELFLGDDALDRLAPPAGGAGAEPADGSAAGPRAGAEHDGWSGRHPALRLARDGASDEADVPSASPAEAGRASTEADPVPPGGVASRGVDGAEAGRPSVGAAGALESAVSGAENAAVIEALIVGHLPVRAGGWAAQYAASAAARSGEAVALLRLEDGSATVDVFGGASVVGGSASGDLAGSLDRLAGRVGHWMLCVDALTQPRLAGHALVDRVTLLTAANDAALVEAYRAMKALVLTGGEAGSGSWRDGGDDDVPALGVAVLGSGADRASESSRRLVEACSIFLGRDVTVSARIARMEPTGHLTAFRGSAGDVSAEELPELIAHARACVPERPAAAAPALAEARRVERAEARSEPVSGAGAGAGALGGVAVARGSGGGGSMGDLAGLISGLRAIDLPAPPEASASFALDGRGVLHAVVVDEGGVGAGKLMSACAWARRHSGLLSMALGADYDAGSEPVAHLLTREPGRAAGLLHGPFRVYALAGVEGSVVAVPMN